MKTNRQSVSDISAYEDEQSVSDISAYEDEQTECSEMSAYKIHTLGNYPEESI